MAIYLFIAFATTLLGYGAVRYRSSSRFAVAVCLVLMVLIFCYFAGARDLSIGTDTAGYGWASFLKARTTSFADFFFNSIYRGWSPLCKVVLWVSANVGRDFFWYLAAMQFVAVVPVVWASYRLCGEYFHLAILIYALIFFPMSFNAMRQFMGLGFLLVSYVWLYRKKLPFFLLFVLVATWFHTSNILGLIVWPLCAFCNRKSLSLSIKMLMIAAVMGITLLLGDSVLLFMAHLTGFYENYVSGEHVVRVGGIRTIVVLFTIFVVGGLFSVLFLRDADLSERNKEHIAALSIVVLFGMLCWGFSLVSFYLYRIGITFCYFSILLVPALVEGIAGRAERNFLAALFTIMFCLYFYDYYVFQNANEVVPYLFSTTGL